MRIAPVILIAIAIYGLIFPQSVLDPEYQEQGRIILVLVVLLAIYGLWRSTRRRDK